MSTTPSTVDRPWYITERWQQFEGEARANQLRVVAIGAFYLIHLWSYFSSQGKLPNWGFLQLASDGQVDRRFHILVTLLVMAWCLMAVAVHFSLRARVFPWWLSIASTLGDVLFLTCLLCISSGPRSPLVLGYFLIITLAALRFSLPLVRVATVAGMLGYVCLLGCARWPETFRVGGSIGQRVPRYHQLMVLLGIALCGIIVGQVVRRVRRLAQEYARRTSHADQDASAS